MKKRVVIIVFIVLAFVSILSFSTTCASTSGAEHYNDNIYKHAKGAQLNADDITGMNRAEDRTRTKDR